MDVNAPPTIHLTNPIGMSTQRTRGDCIAHRFMELQEQYPNHRIGFYYHNVFFSFRFPMWCLLLELFYIKFLLFIECLSGVCIHMNWWSQMENKNTRPTKTKAETQFFRAFFHSCFAFGAMCNPLCLWWSSSTLNVLVFGRPYNDCRSAD